MKTLLSFSILMFLFLGIQTHSTAQKRTNRITKTTLRIWKQPGTQKTFNGRFLKHNNRFVFISNNDGDVIRIQKRFLSKNDLKFINQFTPNNSIIVSKQVKKRKRIANS